MEREDNRLAYLSRPLYSYAESDYLARVSRGTSRRWLSGYTYQVNGAAVQRPPITPGLDTGGEEPGVSFLDLIDVVAIGRLKAAGFSLPLIRRIVQNCQEMLRAHRPLATLRFKAGGREIFVHLGDTLLEVGRKKGLQAWTTVLGPFLEDLEYLEDVVSRWWPLGRGLPVVVDPDYGHGLPVIENSGVRTEIILERFKAGALPGEIAEDFGVTQTEVDRALQFELSRAA
jgi:uncharacterized protein (DUF433 family)